MDVDRPVLLGDAAFLQALEQLGGLLGVACGRFRDGDVQPDVEEIALVLVLAGNFHRGLGADDVGVERLQFFHLVTDVGFHRIGLGHIAKNDLELALHDDTSLD